MRQGAKPKETPVRLVFKMASTRITLFFLIFAGYTLPIGASPPINGMVSEARVATVGLRLATASVALCRHSIFVLGFSIHDLFQYPDASRAGPPFFGETDPVVLGVAIDGPAARAGIHAGDRIEAIDGVAPMVPASTSDKPSFDRSAAVLDQLDRAAADSTVALTIRHGSQRFVRTLVAVRACDTRFELGGARGISAYADGRYVIVSEPAVAFAASDGELAAILAHELSHNILDHPDTARSASKTTVRARELEADRLSVTLMRCAGYDNTESITFWTRFGRRHPLELFPTFDHPSIKERLSALRDAIATVTPLGTNDCLRTE